MFTNSEEELIDSEDNTTACGIANESEESLKTWATDSKEELDSWIEEQGIQLRY